MEYQPVLHPIKHIQCRRVINKFLQPNSHISNFPTENKIGNWRNIRVVRRTESFMEASPFSSSSSTIPILHLVTPVSQRWSLEWRVRRLCWASHYQGMKMRSLSQVLALLWLSERVTAGGSGLNITSDCSPGNYSWFRLRLVERREERRHCWAWS